MATSNGPMEEIPKIENCDNLMKYRDRFRAGNKKRRSNKENTHRVRLSILGMCPSEYDVYLAGYKMGYLYAIALSNRLLGHLVQGRLEKRERSDC